MSYETDLTDDQWAIIEPLLTTKTAQDIYTGGRPRTVNLRAVVNTLFYRTKTGCQWRMIPHQYPKWNIVRYYHDIWTWNGTWDTINTALVKKYVFMMDETLNQRREASIVKRLKPRKPTVNAATMDGKN